MNLNEIESRIESVDKLLNDKNFLRKALKRLREEKKDLEFLKSRCKKRYKLYYEDKKTIEEKWNRVFDLVEELKDMDLSFELFRLNFEEIRLLSEEILTIYERAKIEKSKNEKIESGEMKKIKRRKLKRGMKRNRE